MIHTLEAFDATGTVYAFADLIKAKASMKRSEVEPGKYWLVFPDEPAPWAGRSVWVRKRNQADVTLERERLRWGRVPVLKPVYPFNTAPPIGSAEWMRPFTDALRRPRTQADRELWAQQQEGSYEVDRYDKEASARIFAERYGGTLHQNRVQMHKAAAWDTLRQRFAEDIAHLGERVKKL